MKAYILYGVIALVLIGGGYLTVSKKNAAAPTNSNVVTTDDSLPIRVIKEDGLVTWKKETENDYTRIEQNEIAIPNNSYVKTGFGRGYVILPDNSSISLNQNTEIFVSYTPKKTSIKQLLGSTYHRVMSLGVGNQYEVRTPGTLAAVRGTKFGVSYDEKKKKTQVQVTEHVVSVNTTNENGVETGKEAMSAEVGETVTIEQVLPVQGDVTSTSTFRMSTVKSSDKDPIKLWIDENKEIDNVYDKTDNKLQFIKDITTEVRETLEAETKNETLTGSALQMLKDRKRAAILTKSLKTLTAKKVTTPATTNEDTPSVKTPQSTPTKTPATPTATTPKPAETTKLTTFDFTKDELSTKEEAFIDNFYKSYEMYLFADEKGAVCKTIGGMTASGIVSKLEKIANDAGYILPKKAAITNLATSMVSACADGSILSKSKSLQTTFDVAYPYSE